VASGLVVAMSVAWSTGWPHYSAPVACLLFLLVAQGLRFFWHARFRGRRPLRFLVPLIPALQVGCLIVFYLRQDDAVWFQTWLTARGGIQAMLREQPRDQLVVVRYRQNHLVHAEWVENEADIDHAKIVWAHDLGTPQNEELLDYFRYRQAWLLHADADPPVLQPYP
jgi:hypothetical protein